MLHCYLETQKYLLPQEVERDLKDIIHRKFNNLLRLECHISDNEICDWDIRYDAIHGFQVCLKNHGKLEFTHPIDTWSCWAQIIIEDELFIKYNCKMSDEEYPQREMKPDPTIHQTFKQYLETSTHHSKAWKQAIIAIEFSNLPAELKNL